MGGIRNASDWTPRHSRQNGLRSFAAGIALAALVGAAPSFAETGNFHPDRSVSTSPADLAKRGPADARPPAALASNDPPLTRAAAQLRIDEMSPTRWLSHFGSVSIGHRK